MASDAKYAHGMIMHRDGSIEYDVPPEYMSINPIMVKADLWREWKRDGVNLPHTEISARVFDPETLESIPGSLIGWSPDRE